MEKKHLYAYIAMRSNGYISRLPEPRCLDPEVDDSYRVHQTCFCQFYSLH